MDKKYIVLTVNTTFQAIFFFIIAILARMSGHYIVCAICYIGIISALASYRLNMGEDKNEGRNREEH